MPRCRPAAPRIARLLASVFVLLALLVPGLARAAAPHVPEPLGLDLVRGLGAKRGELEGNVLVMGHPTHGLDAIEWAPEIEWAPRDNLAFELELPVHAKDLQSIKLATQITLAKVSNDRIAHGIQVSGAVGLHRTQRAHALWVRSAALGRRGGITTLIGPQLGIDAPHHIVDPAMVVSAAPFLKLKGGAAIGAELTWVQSLREAELTVLPQLHLPVGKHGKVQVGAGVVYRALSRGVVPIAGLRVVVER